MGRTGRRFSDAQKQRAIREVLAGKSQASVSREHGISQNTLGLWLKAYRSGSLGGEGTGDTDVRTLVVQLRAQEERIAHLERLLGKKEAEIDLLKKLESFERERSSGSPFIASGPGHSPKKKPAR